MCVLGGGRGELIEKPTISLEISVSGVQKEAYGVGGAVNHKTRLPVIA